MDDLVEGERAAPEVLGHEFCDVGVDRDQFYADPDTRDGAPQQDASRGRLERHHARGRRIPEEGIGEDRATAKSIRSEAEHERAHEQPDEGRRHKRRQTAHPEEGGRPAGEHPAAHQARSDDPIKKSS